MTKQIHAARAAEAGVVAAELAALGVTGPPAILEGARGFFRAACPDADQSVVLGEPDRQWGLWHSSTKPWPSPRHTHPAIDAALSIHSQIDGRAIESVEVETYQAAVDLCGHADPVNEHEAKFSIQHCVAAALVDGFLGFESFNEAARARLRSQTVQIRLCATEPFCSAYPKAWGARVQAKFASGTATATRKYAKGDPEAPMSIGELNQKAGDLLRLGGVVMPEATIAAVLEMANGGSCPSLPTNV